jgi:Cys-tRNA(Pro)/Cys-tRNA(Cys) deacylase
VRAARPRDNARVSRKSAKSPASTPALLALEKAGVAHTPRPYHHDPESPLGFGMEVATKLGVDPARVYKTLLASVDDRLVVAVVPVSGKLDLKALAAAVGGKKASMADRDAAERATGYVVGGISPFGQRTALPTVVDERALDLDAVVVSAGRRGLQVEVAPTDLVRLTGATTAPIGRE